MRTLKGKQQSWHCCFPLYLTSFFRYHLNLYFYYRSLLQDKNVLVPFFFFQFTLSFIVHFWCLSIVHWTRNGMAGALLWKDKEAAGQLSVFSHCTKSLEWRQTRPLPLNQTSLSFFITQPCLRSLYTNQQQRSTIRPTEFKGSWVYVHSVLSQTSSWLHLWCCIKLLQVCQDESNYTFSPNKTYGCTN